MLYRSKLSQKEQTYFLYKMKKKITPLSLSNLRSYIDAEKVLYTGVYNFVTWRRLTIKLNLH